MKIKYLLMGLMLAGAAQAPVMAKGQSPAKKQAIAKGRAIEMRADRVVLYPQRMELKGDESLGDVLAMYPDLMQSGFADMLSGYNVRIDNVAINGDMRIVCRQLKASMINTIQICDNTAVAKGTTGFGRVIDITLRRESQGGNNPDHQAISGLTGVEAGTDHLADHHAVVRYDAPKTDVIAISSYAYQDMDDVISQKQHLFAHMTNYFSPHDRLLTYVSQSYQNNRTYGDYGRKEKRQNEKLLARARYFHKFNDKGTELLLVGSYQYGYAPYTYYPDKKDDPCTRTKSDATLFIVELNTPLTEKLSMMAGWEGDFNYNKYLDDYWISDGGNWRPETKYTSSNNDLYLQFNYLTGIWRFTLGDRVMFYHYSTDGGKKDEVSRDMKHNETRNNIEASVIASVTGHSQIQAAYHRKFINPSFVINEPLSFEQWLDFKEGLIAKNIDETKLGYTYTQGNFNLSLAAYYQMIEHADNRCKLSASAFYRTGILGLTAGANFYSIKGDGNDYATFHFNPRITLPGQMALNIQSIFTAGNMHLLDDKDVYLSGQLTKQFDKHWNGAVEWHDICSKHYSAAMATLQYLF